MDEKTREIERLAQTINVVKNKKEDEIWRAMLKEERKEKLWQQMLLTEKAQRERAEEESLQLVSVQKKNSQPEFVERKINVLEETKSLRFSFWIGVGILSLTAFLSFIMLFFPQAFFPDFNTYSSAVAVVVRVIVLGMIILPVLFACSAINQYKTYKYLSSNFSGFYLINLIIGAVIIIFNYLFVDLSKIGFLQRELSQGYAFVFIWLPLIGFVANIVCNFCSRLVRISLKKFVLLSLSIVLAFALANIAWRLPGLQFSFEGESMYASFIDDSEDEVGYFTIDEEGRIKPILSDIPQEFDEASKNFSETINSRSFNIFEKLLVIAPGVPIWGYCAFVAVMGPPILLFGALWVFYDVIVQMGVMKRDQLKNLIKEKGTTINLSDMIDESRTRRRHIGEEKEKSKMILKIIFESGILITGNLTALITLFLLGLQDYIIIVSWPFAIVFSAGEILKDIIKKKIEKETQLEFTQKELNALFN